VQGSPGCPAGGIIDDPILYRSMEGPTGLAVTLNGRLDYFGQAVNIAARVQALSEANEIYLTDEMLSITGAEELLAAFATEARSVQLKGVQGHIRVHRVHLGSGRTVKP
jgi:class 3 adenylate cyclase